MSPVADPTCSNVCPNGVGPITPDLPSGAPSPPTVGTSTSPASSGSSGTSTSTSPGATGSTYDNGDGGLDDDDDFAVCDFTLTFDNLDDLNTATGNLRTDCIAIYTLETLMTMLDTAYANYTSVNDGYDEEFGHYVTYITKLVQPTIDDNVMFDSADTTETMPIAVPGPGMSCTFDPPLILR